MSGVRMRGFVLAMVVGGLLRLAALPLPGTEDVNVWKVWSYAGAKDVTAVYGVGGDPPVRGMLKYGRTYTTVDYPPVALYELAIVGSIYGALFPAYPNTWTLVAALKLPGLLAGIGLTWVIYVTVRRETRRRALAEMAALTYWLNPAAILDAEVLGYLDPLMMLPALAAFVLLVRRRFAAAGACLALALLTKPQALLVVPAWLFALWLFGRAAGGDAATPTSPRPSPHAAWLRAVAGGAATALAAIAPFAIVGALPNMWLAFGSFYARRDILSGTAANVWWIANYLSRAVHGVADLGWRAFFTPVARVMAVSTFMEQGLPDPRPFGQIAIVLLVGWAFWRVWRTIRASADAFALSSDVDGRVYVNGDATAAADPHALVAALTLAAFTVHAMFVLGVGVHEHHQILMVPLLALAAALRPSLRGLFVVVSLICALNLNLFYGLGRGWPYALPRMALLIDATVLLSLVNIVALIWHARLIARAYRLPAVSVALAPSTSP